MKEAEVSQLLLTCFHVLGLIPAALLMSLHCTEYIVDCSYEEDPCIYNTLKQKYV